MNPNGTRTFVLLEGSDGNSGAWINEAGVVIQPPKENRSLKGDSKAALEAWAKQYGYTWTYGRRM
jgi:hypothetical protein